MALVGVGSQGTVILLHGLTMKGIIPVAPKTAIVVPPMVIRAYAV
jgi:hypothetical protein